MKRALTNEGQFVSSVIRQQLNAPRLRVDVDVGEGVWSAQWSPAIPNALVAPSDSPHLCVVFFF